MTREHGRDLDGRTTCADWLLAPARGEKGGGTVMRHAGGYKQAGQADRHASRRTKSSLLACTYNRGM